MKTPEPHRTISSSKTGLPPGSLVHIGRKRSDTVRVTVIDYDSDTLRETPIEQIEDCFAFKDTNTVTWINIDGLHRVDLIEKIGKHFDIHPLVLEDVVHTGQRPKCEDHDRYLFVVLKMLRFDDAKQRIIVEQVSVLLCGNVVISFQEEVGDVFDAVRQRIRNSKGRIRNMRADYLAYALIDAVVDQYFVILEAMGEQIEAMEEMVIRNPTDKILRQIHATKRQLITLRKSIWPLREVIGCLEKSESVIVADTTQPYFRDVYDHCIQVIDTVEGFRDMASGLLDIYLSGMSNRMNAVMKVLTIIATIFIPLTFVAGIYGMNFDHMPELHWRWGYGMVWGVMAVIAGAMVIFFKRKRWL